MTRRVVAVLVGLMIVTGAACDLSQPGPSDPTIIPTSDAPAPDDDSAGEQACALFRDVASGAFGESMSEAEVVSGLQDVGDIAADSTNPAIKNNAEEVAAEGSAKSMINGTANRAQDGLAEACNKAYPI